MSFPKKITEKLLERDYNFVPRLSDGELVGNDSKYISFLKQSGTAVYGVVLLRADNSFDYRDVYIRLKETFYQFAGGINCTNAYYVGLFVGSDEDAELRDFCTNDIEDYTLKLNEISWIVEVEKRRILVSGQTVTVEDGKTLDRPADPVKEGYKFIGWIVDVEKKRIFVRGSQPDKLLDLNELIDSALAETDASYSPNVEMRTLMQNEIDKRRESIKSGNILCTAALILINVVLLALTYITGGIGTENMVRMGALSTELLFNHHQYYRLFTAMFLHFGVIHLASNMLFLYVFGSVIERYYGKVKFLLIYLGAGLAGNIVYALLSDGVAAGASGAVFGLVGAMLSFSRIIKRSVEGKDTYFMILFAIISICGGMFMEGVANSAHIGGFVFGLIAGHLMYKKE